MRTLQCPVCGTDMRAETRGDVTIDVCAEHGVWLDRAELLLLTEQARHVKGSPGALWQDLFLSWTSIFQKPLHPPNDPHRVLSCPLCSEEMRLIRYEGVTIDWCPSHGVWLDSGELEAIIHNLHLDPAYLRGVALRVADAQY